MDVVSIAFVDSQENFWLHAFGIDHVFGQTVSVKSHIEEIAEQTVILISVNVSPAL